TMGIQSASNPCTLEASENTRETCLYLSVLKLSSYTAGSPTSGPTAGNALSTAGSARQGARARAAADHSATDLAFSATFTLPPRAWHTACFHSSTAPPAG